MIKMFAGFKSMSWDSTKCQHRYRDLTVLQGQNHNNLVIMSRDCVKKIMNLSNLTDM